MLVRDLMVGDKGIFHYMNEYKELPFIEFTDIEILDLLFISMYGNRKVSPLTSGVVKSSPIEVEEIEKLAKMVHLYYGKSWSDIYKIMSEELSLETYIMTTTETITDSETNKFETTNEHSKKDLDKVSGFNSDVMVDDTSREYESEDTVLNEGNRDNERQITKEVRGNPNNALKDRDYALKQVQENLVYDTVFKDVSNMISLLIY